MRLLIVGLVTLLAVLQYTLWFSSGGLADVAELEKANAAQIFANAKLEERNQSLTAEVDDLKQGLEAVEERARSEMGMVKQGEVFYQIVEPIERGPAVAADN